MSAVTENFRAGLPKDGQKTSSDNWGFHPVYEACIGIPYIGGIFGFLTLGPYITGMLVGDGLCRVLYKIEVAESDPSRSAIDMESYRQLAKIDKLIRSGILYVAGALIGAALGAAFPLGMYIGMVMWIGKVSVGGLLSGAIFVVSYAITSSLGAASNEPSIRSQRLLANW